MINWKSKLCTLLFLLAISLAASAQKASKYGFELAEFLKTVSSEYEVPLLVEGKGALLPEIVSGYQGKVRLQVGDLFSLQIPAKNVEAFSKENAVQLIEFSMAKGQTLSDTMLIHTNVDSVIQQAFPLRNQYTGKGVVLGVIDSGVELAHDDFKDSLGNTRVLYVWDQGVPFDPNRQALTYNYGVEWDSAAINSGASTHDDKAAEFGHGSNVTGAAASNGLASGHFRGVAPEVNIISVATDFRKPNWLQTVAESVDYIFKKADALGMPCVINASVGTYIGSHDGKDIAARMIANMIQQKSGRALVCAAGNAGNIPFHVQQQTNNDSAFTWFENNVAQWAGLGGYYFEVWGDTNNMNNLRFSIGADEELSGTFTFKGRLPFDNIQNRLNVIVTDTLFNSTGDQLAIIETYAEESQGRYKLEVAIVDPDSANFLYRFETVGTGKIDIYSSYSLFRHNNMRNSNLPTSQQFPSIINYAMPDTLQTMVSSFTCSPATITVGNHYNRATYTNVNGVAINNGNTPGAIAFNSSLGPNRNNLIKPDVTSAGGTMFGTGRLATLASAIQSNPNKVSFDSLHFLNGGTSMASPTVAGMIALYLQMCPKASHTQIMTDLIASAKGDQFTSNLPNPQWGNGKADAFQLLKRQVFAPANPIITPNFCAGDSVNLSLNPNFLSFNWNTGDTVSSIVVNQSGDYFAEVENQQGCLSNSDTASITFHPLPAKPTITQNGNSLTIAANGSFQWYFNTFPIMGATGNSYQAISSGNYHCVYTDSNGCSINTDTIPVIVTGLKEHHIHTFSILPNPSNGRFRLTFNEPSAVRSVRIYTAQGSLVWVKNKLGSRQQLDLNLSHLSKGIYFLKIESNQRTELKKLMIE